MTAATGNYVYLRQLQEAAARRRLEVAKLLRDNPATTNKQLASALNVSRNTITLDRKIMVEALTQNTLTETELLRAEMVGKLEHLNTELELHRTDGKLPVSVIHEALLVTRSIIELLGVRKPVVEKLEIKKRTINFTTSIVRSDGSRTEPKQIEFVTKQLSLTEGRNEQH
jgi:transcriptional antiterminator